MKLKKHVKIILLLAIMFISYTIINGTFSIYRETKTDTINLSILDPNGMVTVTFNPNTGTIAANDATRSVQTGTAVGTLPTPTKADHNFLGWFTDPTAGVQISSQTTVTGSTVTYYAHWAKIVCKKAQTGTLHTETCLSDGSCKDSGGGYSANDTITYGTIPTAGSPFKGDAYDCDVNNDDVWDPLTERFYYVRSYGTTDPKENSVLVHFTSFDDLGQMDSSSDRGSYEYEEALTYLPTATTWDNPSLISMNGNVTRFPSVDDITSACGSATGGAKFASCRFYLEHTRYQSKSLGRAGIWLEEYTNNTFHRIHTENLAVATVEHTSINTARPTIEIPSNTIEDFVGRDVYTVTFDPNDGSISQADATRNVLAGDTIGQLPTPTYVDHEFLGWYTDPTNGTQITASTVVNTSITYYAHWEEVQDPFQYVFHIPGECTFTSTGITDGTNGNCVSTINPTGSNIDYTDSTLSARKYIDTGIALYGSTYHSRDYEIHFEIVSYDGSQNESQATFVNTKKEGNNYPGLVVRKSTNDNSKIEFASRKTANANANVLLNVNSVTKMSVYRIGNEIFYSINDGELVSLTDLTQYNPEFDLTTWFGAAPKDAQATTAQRFLTGTLSNIYIKIGPDNSNKVNVTFNPNYEGATNTTKEVAVGAAVGTLPTPTRTGYTLLGWFTDPTNGTQITSQTVITSAITFYAHWHEDVTVTLQANGGTVTPNTITVPYNTAVGTLPTPTKANNTFAGWYQDQQLTTPATDQTVITEDTDFYAKWIPDVTVTLNANGGTVSPASITVGQGEEVGTLPTPTKANNTFAGWYQDQQLTTPATDQTVITQDTEFFAKWIPDVTVTLNANGGTVSPASITVSQGDEVGTLPTPTKTGNTFGGWYQDQQLTTPATSTTVITQDTEFFAKWIENITVTFNADGGTVTPNTKTFPSGTAIGELPTPEYTGYDFLGWFTDNTYTTEVTTQTVFTTSTTIIAKWLETQDITVTFNADGGTVTPNSKTFAPGGAIGELPTPTKTDNLFVGWFTDNTYQTEVTEETTFQESTTIIAKWVDETYVACIGSTCYTTLKLAITAVPTTGVATTVKVIQDIAITETSTIANNQNVVLDIGSYTISNSTARTDIFVNNGTLNISNGTITCESENTSAKKGYIIKNNAGGVVNISGGTLHYTRTADGEGKVIESSGTVNITGGELLCDSQAAVINVNAGTLTVSGGRLIGSHTKKGQAIYNNGGTTTISGTAYLENNSQAGSQNGRSAVTNNAGTVNILGGTIISKNNAGVKNNGTMVIGIDDQQIDTTTPVIQGSTYGIEAVSGKSLIIYDGIFKGKGTTQDKAINNESYVTTGGINIVHDTETIGGVQYDVAYLEDPSVNYTVTFNAGTGTVTPNTKTYQQVGPIGTLPTATKANTEFLGWFTQATGGDRVLTTTEVNADVTYYAHYTNATTVCKPATTLHSYNSTDFGQIPTSSSLSSGDAFDCDVNGDGTYDATNERFYYLTDTSDGKAVFIYSNNIHQNSGSASPMCKPDAIAYGTYSEGPNTAITELPTTSQWTNVNIYTEPREITNQNGTTIVSDYVYTGKAARLANLDEIKAATSASINGTTNEFASYTYLLENTASYGDCRSNYWIETTNSSAGAYRIDGAANAKRLGHADGSSAIRPVIEVPYASIEGAAKIVEFDMIPAAMRVYFNNVSTWNAGQDDSNYSAFNTAMVNNLTTYNCAYYQNDNTSTQYGSVFCDQPNQYDTGVTGNVNVYEYDESTGVVSNTQATYVSNDNGKLYNFIPGKTYYWESATDSTKNGYVRPTGERRLITIPGTTRQTRNVRDLGGLPVDTDGDGTIDGTVKYQKLYRGEKIWGTNRNGTTRSQFEKLGIYNELDLRTPGSEIVASEEDQLTNYISNEIVHYKIDHTEFGLPATEPRFNGKSYYQLARDAAIDVMQRVVAGNDDYALFFHCRIGADRTGTLAYILEGLLGVPTEYRHQDYELTTFFGLRERTRYYYNKDSNTYKFLYLKKAIRHATPGNNEITGEENVMDWFLLEGNTTNECNDISALITQFRAKMIDYN